MGNLPSGRSTRELISITLHITVSLTNIGVKVEDVVVVQDVRSFVSDLFVGSELSNSGKAGDVEGLCGSDHKESIAAQVA